MITDAPADWLRSNGYGGRISPAALSAIPRTLAGRGVVLTR
jgi:hypothetical protein